VGVAGMIILLAWFALIVFGVAFILIYGDPRKSPDPQVSWHLVVATGIGVIQPIAFTLSGISLWPSAVVEVVAAGVFAWRLVLLVQTRRQARAARAFERQIIEQVRSAQDDDGRA